MDKWKTNSMGAGKLIWFLECQKKRKYQRIVILVNPAAQASGRHLLRCSNLNLHGSRVELEGHRRVIAGQT
jgi:hypothetical protein